MVGGPFIVSTCKAVFDKTLIGKPTNLSKSIVRRDASQLFPYMTCQPMPTGLYTRWNYDSESQKFMPRQNKTRSFENMVLSYFQQTHPECKTDSNVTTGRRVIALVLMEFVTILTLSLKQGVVISTTVYVEKLARHWLTRKLWDGWKRGNKTKCAKSISNRKDTKLLECGSAISGNYTELMPQ